MTNNYVGKRIFYYDLIRVIAILCVIFCHSSRVYDPIVYTSLKAALPGFFNIMGRIGVPLFFMISGALLLNREYDLANFFKKRFSRILYPAVFWIALACVLMIIFLPNENIIPIIFGQNRYTWFVWTILGIYLITPVINSFIKEYGMRGVEYYLIFWFITIIIATFHISLLHELDLSYFARYLGYFVLGYYLTNKKFKLHSLVLSLLGIVLYILFTLLNMYIQYNGINIKADNLSIPVLMASIGAFIAIKYLVVYFENKHPVIHNKLINGKFGDLIFTVSACSYGMYFANSMILQFVKRLDIPSIKMFPLVFIGVALLSFILVFVFSKIPVIKKFSGVA